MARDRGQFGAGRWRAQVSDLQAGPKHTLTLGGRTEAWHERAGHNESSELRNVRELEEQAPPRLACDDYDTPGAARAGCQQGPQPHLLRRVMYNTFRPVQS